MKTQPSATVIMLVVCLFTWHRGGAQESKQLETSDFYEIWEKKKEQEYNAWIKEKESDYNAWLKQKEEEYQQYLKNHTEWNRIVLGEDVKPAVVELSEEEVEKAGLELLTPRYVAIEVDLDNELKVIKKKIGQVVAEEIIKDSLYQKEINAIPNIAPVQGNYRVSSAFGYRSHPIYKRIIHHDGIDLACPKGTPVLAPASGTIEQAGWVKGYGNFIKIRHGNGYVTVYGHLSGINVRKGEHVDKESIIGRVGSTGKSTGMHLHYEIVKNGKKIDPKRHLG
nr:M23 family metallopeptidase [uncultured Draconibacterium sp.]